MKYYRLKTKAGVYAGSVLKVDRFGELRAIGFKPTENPVLAKVYSEEEKSKIEADIIRLSDYVKAKKEEITLEETEVKEAA